MGKLNGPGVGPQLVTGAVDVTGSGSTPGLLSQIARDSRSIGIMATTARINSKTGIAEHKHDNLGFHWASAGHRDDGKVHKDSQAEKPTFVEGTTPEQQEIYGKSLRREDGFVAKIPSKAKPKDMTPATTESQTMESKDVKEMPAAVTPPAGNGGQTPRPASAQRTPAPAR